MLARKAQGTGGLIEGELGAEPEAVLALVDREAGCADQSVNESARRRLVGHSVAQKGRVIEFPPVQQ